MGVFGREAAGRMTGVDRAHVLLEQALGPGAQFRDGQLDAIEALVNKRARVLVVQRTGWGKSLVYFLATRLLRDRGAGPTLLVSPLLSLMRDQIRMADAFGIVARTINSANTDDWDRVDAELRDDGVDLLLVSPERLANLRFRQALNRMRAIGLLVVDEAHCISDWGHDFRPDYRRIRSVVSLLPPTVPVLATTATASNRVIEDISAQLGAGLTTVRGPLDRDSIRLMTVPLDEQADRLAWLAENLPTLPGSGIVYCLTVRDCERVTAWLRSRGIPVEPYHGGQPDERRIELERALRGNRVKALVATVALGMGFDKPDLAFVVHFQRPGSPIAYYQQVGRAGRALHTADVVLLAGAEDDAIARHFIATSFPAESEMRAVLETVERLGVASRARVLAEVNLRAQRVDQCLKLLEADRAVVRDSAGYARTVHPWTPDSSRAMQVTALRNDELDQMRRYVDCGSCLMEFLRQALDDPFASPCGRCANCAGEFLPRTPDSATRGVAERFLRHADRPLKARLTWPPGAVSGRGGRIPESLQAEPGRVLAAYGAAGWGERVRDAKYRDQHFDDDLVMAAADLIRRSWRPTPSPTWVTGVPSLRTNIVADFATRLARLLNLLYDPAVQKVRETVPQKDMQNSAHQLANVAGAFEVSGRVSTGPVLLVDDVVDSGWSLTEVAFALRSAGAGPVFPFALADSSHGAG